MSVGQMIFDQKMWHLLDKMSKVMSVDQKEGYSYVSQVFHQPNVCRPNVFDQNMWHLLDNISNQMSVNQMTGSQLCQ